jgi:hypothetical protein
MRGNNIIKKVCTAKKGERKKRQKKEKKSGKMTEQEQCFIKLKGT